MSVDMENERADAMRHAGLDQTAFRAAWKAMQNCPIDLLDDSDDAECKALCAAICTYLAHVK